MWVWPNIIAGDETYYYQAKTERSCNFWSKKMGLCWCLNPNSPQTFVFIFLLFRCREHMQSTEYDDNKHSHVENWIGKRYSKTKRRYSTMERTGGIYTEKKHETSCETKDNKLQNLQFDHRSYKYRQSVISALSCCPESNHHSHLSTINLRKKRGQLKRFPQMPDASNKLNNWLAMSGNESADL